MSACSCPSLYHHVWNHYLNKLPYVWSRRSMLVVQWALFWQGVGASGFSTRSNTRCQELDWLVWRHAASLLSHIASTKSGDCRRLSFTNFSFVLSNNGNSIQECDGGCANSDNCMQNNCGGRYHTSLLCSWTAFSLPEKSPGQLQVHLHQNFVTFGSNDALNYTWAFSS